nr:hypothetical protein [Tanacetum cinerariifolium]
MSDSDESGVIYTDALPAPDYIHGPEEPEQAPPLPDYVPGPKHADDEIVAEDQPYAEDASPTTQSLEYVPESDLKAHPGEDDDKDPEEDPVDYHVDGGDDGDDEEGSSKDDEDDDMDIEADKEEKEEEHPDPANFVSAATPPPHPAYHMTARISILALLLVPAWSDSEVVRLLAMSSPPSLPLSHLSLSLPRIPFPPIPSILSPPSPVLSPAPPPSPICSLGYRAAMIRLRAEAASTSHSLPLPPPFIVSSTRFDAPSSGIPLPLPISAFTSSPPLQLPSASRRKDRPDVTLPPWKRLGIALGLRYEVGESSSAAAVRPAGGLRADYDFDATMDKEIRRDPKREARLSREAWVRSTDASDFARGEVMSLRTTVLGQMTEIRELHAADHRRQIVTSEMLRADHRRFAEIKGMRTTDRTGDSPTETSDSLIGTCYRTTRTAGTGWRSYTARATRGGWILQNLTGIVFSCDSKKMAPKRTTRSIADQETTNTTSVTNAQLQAMIDQCVTAALAARDALRSTNGDHSHNSGTCVRRTERATRKCTYTEFLKCQPLHFKGIEGVSNLSQWFERMKSVFHISNCAVENQVKFATCTLHSITLTWWNTRVKTVGHDAAYDESGVTYTDISSPFEELSYIGSPRADDHEHLMLPEMLKDPYVEVAL